MGILYLSLAIIINTLANGFFKSSADITDLTLRKGVLLGLGLFLGSPIRSATSSPWSMSHWGLRSPSGPAVALF